MGASLECQPYTPVCPGDSYATSYRPYYWINWHLSFLKRNPELKRRLGKPLDRQRTAAAKPEILQRWFNLYKQVVIKLNIFKETSGI